MDKSAEAQKSPCQENDAEISSNSEYDRRNMVPPSKRIYKDHDLDKLLIYTKRGSKKSSDFYEEWNQRELEQLQKKKQRKKEKMFAKKQSKINQQSKEKTNKEKNTSPLSQSPVQLPPQISQLKSKQKIQTVQKAPKPKILQPIHKTVYKIEYQKFQEYDNKFPLTNQYLTNHSSEYVETYAKIDQAKQKLDRPPTSSASFVNCDVKYFNWNLFIEEVGKFDVLIIDPPWRIKGAQKNDSQFMFSNCRFSLEYNTMSNHEIKTLPLHLISDQGFIFLWILNTQLNASLEIMQSWGYQLVEEIIWVKLRNEKIYLTHGYYFMHSYEICLVGYKNTKKKLLESEGNAQNASNEGSMNLREGLNYNVIFGQVRKKSQKPEDLYNIIEMIFKGKRKIQIFARNHNLKFGIFSIGNQLGEAYDKWTLHLKCDACKEQISTQSKRYKSKVKANFDLCQKCAETHNKQFFFELSNEVDEDIRHEYVTCNICGIQPIWGNRFQCVTCADYDLCQNCYDHYLVNRNDNEATEKLHPQDHDFRVLEVPVFGNGYHIHEYKCNSCYQNPILGVCFSCTDCRNFKLCQKCFFQRPRQDKGNFSKTHRQGHEFQIIFEPIYNEQKKFQCFNCKKSINEECWMCENCYNFFFCDQCYNRRDSFKSLYANTHKKYHVYTKLF